jgi:hypothetical protein
MILFREERMMNMLACLPAALLLAAMAGCASSSSIPSVTEPGFQSTTFAKIAVVADIEDVVWKKRIESQIVGAFNAEGIESVESITLAGGILSTSDTALTALLKKNNIDAYLVVTTGDEGTTEIVTPPSKIVNPIPTDESGILILSRPRQGLVDKPGDNTFYPRGELRSMLFDAGSRKQAWSAVSHNEMNVYTNLSLLIKSYCHKVVAQMIHDGLVKPVPKTGIPDIQ